MGDNLYTEYTSSALVARKKTRSKKIYIGLGVLAVIIVALVFLWSRFFVSAKASIMIQVAEPQVEAKIVKLKAQATDDPQYQAVKAASATNLVIPTAHAFAIIDADTGKLLAGNHSDDQRQIASLTKMMTATLVMDNIKNPDDPVTIDDEEVYIDGTRIGCPVSGHCVSQRLKTGEQVSAINLLQAMLMNSANDAATALGKHMANTSDAFADMMNERAAQMDLPNTHFCTPSGLETDGHETDCYSSAYDIGRIAAYSMRYDTIWKMFRLPTNSQITSVDGQTVHTLINSDKLVDQIPNLIGGKTGFTPLAGYSLLMGVWDPSKKHRVIVVLLDDPTMWQDIRTAIDWTFTSYSWK